MSIAKTPSALYYAVIFTSIRTDGDNGYARMSGRMLELAKQQPGYLGYETRTRWHWYHGFVLEGS